jgi:hypothetical protein
MGRFAVGPVPRVIEHPGQLGVVRRSVDLRHFARAAGIMHHVVQAYWQSRPRIWGRGGGKGAFSLAICN